MHKDFPHRRTVPGKRNIGMQIPLDPLSLPPAPAGYKPTYIDLDGDGDPDILRTVTANGIPVQWIDDDDDMQYGDLEAIPITTA